MTDPDSSDDGSGEDSGLFAKSLTGLLWSAAQKSGAAVIQVVVHLVLARLLLPEHFGLVAMAQVAVSFIGLLKDQGFGVALIQREDLEDLHLDVGFWTLLGVGLALAGIGWLAAPWAAYLFGEPKLEPVLRVLVINVPIASVGAVPDAILRREMRFKTLSIRTLIAALMGGVAAVGLAFAGWGVWALVVKSLTTTIVGTTIVWSASNWWPRFQYSKRHLQDLFSFGVNITGQKILNFINRQSDDLIVGYVLGAQALGYYTIAYEILKGMTDLLSRTMTNVALPAFSRLQNDIPKLRRAWLGGIQMTALVSIPIFLLYIAVTPELLHVIYGPKWAPAIPTARVLGFIGILHSVALFNPPVLKALGKPSWEFGLSVLNVIGNLIGFLIAVQFGIMWVAAAYVIRGYLFTPVELYLVRKLIDYEWAEYFKQFSFPLFGCALMLAGVFGLRSVALVDYSHFVVLISSIVAGLTVYVTYAFAFLPDSVTRLIERVREEISSD